MNESIQKGEELLPLVDEEGRITGTAPRSICHSGSRYLHPVVHLHVVNEQNEIYLQKRPAFKKVQPGKWDTAVGGHISAGERVGESLAREAYEEIGIQDFQPELAAEYIWETSVEREYVYSFITRFNGSITPNLDEVDCGRFWSRAEIGKKLGSGILTPNFEEEFRRLFLSGQTIPH